MCSCVSDTATSSILCPMEPANKASPWPGTTSMVSHSMALELGRNSSCISPRTRPSLISSAISVCCSLAVTSTSSSGNKSGKGSFGSIWIVSGSIICTTTGTAPGSMTACIGCNGSCSTTSSSLISSPAAGLSSILTSASSSLSIASRISSTSRVCSGTQEISALRSCESTTGLEKVCVITGISPGSTIVISHGRSLM